MDQLLITRIVEAALLAANQPLTLVQLHGLFPLDQPAPEGSIGRALESLQEDCAQRGVELVEVASGFRYQVKHDVHEWVARLWTERQTRYTRATLETLALIAYRQPITRGEIEQVRGVAVNSNIIRALEEREWVRVVGHRDVPGRPELLATTKTFLDYFGLKRLDELPSLSELKEIGELEPQFQFEGERVGHQDETPRDVDMDDLPVGDMAMAGDVQINDDQFDQDADQGADNGHDTKPLSEPANDAFADPHDPTADDSDAIAMSHATPIDALHTSDHDTDDDAIAASSEQKDE